LIKNGKVIAKGIYEFTANASACVQCHANPLEKSELSGTDAWSLCNPGLKYATGLRMAFGGVGIEANLKAPRPTKFGITVAGEQFDLDRIEADQNHTVTPLAKSAKDGLEGFVESALKAAADAQLPVVPDPIRLALARKRLAVAQAEVDQVQAEVARATKFLEIARAGLLEMERSATVPKPQPIPAGDASFTIHLRPQLEGEQTHRLMLKDSEYVLNGIAFAAKYMTIKPETVNMWVVRDKKALPVDLTALFIKGNTSTNYQLHPGDQLFVQFKVEKQ
jgi:hypothetical protein